MKSNPGGYIAPEHAVGRDQDVADLWGILENQSVYMNAERRIGKTTILTKLAHQPPAGWTAVQRDLENLHSAEDFALAVYSDIDGFLTRAQRTKRRLKELLRSVSGTEVAGFLKLPTGDAIHWKVALEKSIEDLSDTFADGGGRLLFLWDELPFMVANIARRQGDDTAMQVLDVLRYLRQTHPSLRMILTGSVGLHHVIARLKDSGYRNSPVNDMHAFEVRPLSPEAGQQLAMLLLQGEGVPSSDAAQAAAALSAAVDHFPYYVHHLVSSLKRARRAAEAPAIEATLAALLGDPNDPWQLRHYRERVRTYYGDDERLVLAVLDAVANVEAASFEQILRAVKATWAAADREKLRALLGVLQRDHYIQRQEGGAFAFCFPLIRRWWRLERGLPSGTP
jgi:hypothetical protein